MLSFITELLFPLLGDWEPGLTDVDGICVEIFRNAVFCKGKELVQRINKRRQTFSFFSTFVMVSFLCGLFL